MRVLTCVPLIFLIACTSACAVDSFDAKLAKDQRRTDQIVAALAIRTDADSLAAAGLMSVIGDRERVLGLLARATAAAPNRPDLLWLQAVRCAQSPPCDPVPIEQRLRDLDPGNGAGWWGAVARAGAAHDAEGIDAALDAISHTERVDIYWTTLIAHLSGAVANTKKISLRESEVAIIGYLAALAIPAYQYVSKSCNGQRLQQPGVTAVCRGVAKALQNSDTYLTEMIGVAIAKRVWPEDSPEWKAAAEEHRVYEYRSKLITKLELQVLSQPGEYLALCTQNRSEQDVFAAALTAAGYDPNPPAQ